MEVHHHSQTARKKWTHYFWEFFMLFLAVTEINRFDSRRIGYRIFGFFHNTYVRRYINPSFTVDSSTLLDKSPLLLGEYINNIYKFADTSQVELYPRLKQQFKLAENLIGLIKKEYHIK